MRILWYDTRDCDCDHWAKRARCGSFESSRLPETDNGEEQCSHSQVGVAGAMESTESHDFAVGAERWRGSKDRD